MRIAGEAQATFDGDDRWLVSVFGGARVVGTTRCIRYVYPARGASFLPRISAVTSPRVGRWGPGAALLSGERRSGDRDLPQTTRFRPAFERILGGHRNISGPKAVTVMRQFPVSGS